MAQIRSGLSTAAAVKIYLLDFYITGRENTLQHVLPAWPFRNYSNADTSQLRTMDTDQSPTYKITSENGHPKVTPT